VTPLSLTFFKGDAECKMAVKLKPKSETGTRGAKFCWSPGEDGVSWEVRRDGLGGRRPERAREVEMQNLGGIRCNSGDGGATNGSLAKA
jgi:hypothetical protein